MKIAVLGTGMVGRALAGKLSEVGHEVVVGTRDPTATLARAESGRPGSLPYSVWQQDHPEVGLLRFDEAGRDEEVIVNATPGSETLAVLATVGDALDGKVLVDVANPLAFSGEGMTLSPVNTDSLAEQIQRIHPRVRVVKTLNTVTAAVMVEPSRVPGDHHVFLASDDIDAKQVAARLLADLGWQPPQILDLGGLRAARGCEMYLMLWLSLQQTLGTPIINIRVERAAD